jgi:hypothetical protein
MALVKQASVVVGLISAAVGLFFLLFPQFRPERGQSSPEQSASVDRISPPNRHTTRGDFLDYIERQKVGLTKQQLQEVGASAFATIKIVGYKGRTSPWSARSSMREPATLLVRQPTSTSLLPRTA